MKEMENARFLETEYIVSRSDIIEELGYDKNIKAPRIDDPYYDGKEEELVAAIVKYKANKVLGSEVDAKVRSERTRLENLFITDLKEYCEITDHPKADKLIQIVQENYSRESYYNTVLFAMELSELLID